MNDWDELMDFAAQTVAGAGEITLRHFGSVAVEYKGDGSEVTEADRAAEAYVRAAIAEAFPEDGILGEEADERPSESGRRWIVDPIDGTRTFSCGVPLYSVLLALEVDGVISLGCVHLPALGHTLVAARGAGAWIDGRAARVSECEEISEARLVTSGLEYWRDMTDDAGRAGFQRLVEATRLGRTWGDGYGYFLVATGRVDLLADPTGGKVWDYAPMTVIIPEAGGRITQFDGSPMLPNRSALASNGELHRAARRILQGE